MSPFTPDDPTLDLFKELILNTCGFTLEMGREQSLVTGLRERMAARGSRSAEEYHALLLSDRGELNGLVELLAVNETYFFREPDHLNMAVDQLLPELLEGRRERPVSIVSAGCSTGEEPYSVAMMLRDRHGEESGRLFAITGVDIDSGAIAAARRGVYGKQSFRGLGQGALERHFQPAGSGEFRVREEIRRQVSFEVANLLGPVYPPGMQQPDLILYRNVSIYFPQDVQQKIFAQLARLLTEGGYLMVGASETIHHNTGILALVQRGPLFFYRKGITGSGREPRRAGGAAGRSGAAPAEPLQYRRPFQLPQRRQAERPQPVPVRPRAAAEAYRAALALARGGESEKAMGQLAELIGQEPGCWKAKVLLGSLLLQGGRYDEAAAVCEAVVAEDPLCLEACLMLGIVARHRGDNDEAFRRFRQAVYLDASCWLAHFYNGEILFSRGDSRQARGSYERALRLLEEGGVGEQGEAFFHLPLNSEQFVVICRHKLSLLKENG